MVSKSGAESRGRPMFWRELTIDGPDAVAELLGVEFCRHGPRADGGLSAREP